AASTLSPPLTPSGNAYNAIDSREIKLADKVGIFAESLPFPSRGDGTLAIASQTVGGRNDYCHPCQKDRRRLGFGGRPGRRGRRCNAATGTGPHRHRRRDRVRPWRLCARHCGRQRAVLRLLRLALRLLLSAGLSLLCPAG